MNNFKDIYIRNNPRKNAKMNPVMWDDNTSRYFSHKEGFTGDYKNVTGDLYNVVIDLRENSSTYHEWVAISLSSEKRESIHVPAGCANAFLTTIDNTIVHYYMGDSFNPDTYYGIRYNDPMFSIKWPCEPEVISDKDLNIADYIVK